MYHFIIKQLVRQVIARLNTGDCELLLRRSASGIRHTFSGSHPLGGTRRSKAGVRKWWARLFLLCPGWRCEIRKIVAGGWPWDTTVAVEVAVRATLKTGKPYTNEGVLLMDLRWGRMTGLREYLDSDKVVETCRFLAAQGVSEASAVPIEE